MNNPKKQKYDGKTWEERLAASLPESVANPGYSSCRRCILPWAVVEGHSTDINGGTGMFPLCEQCWQDLGTGEARLPYYRALWHGWEEPKNVTLAQVEAAVMAEGEEKTFPPQEGDAA